MASPKYWSFSNHKSGRYDESVWDTSTILSTNRYPFQRTDKNRQHVKVGDQIVLREYGSGYWGTCEIASDWIEDVDSAEGNGWFEIAKLQKWQSVLPFEVIHQELSNKNHRIRICKLKETDFEKIALAFRIYTKLGYGDTDGSFFILESGVEEAVKANLSQLHLVLAEESIQQQCVMCIGVGKSDLICRDDEGNFVVLELKAVQSSDVVVGQILRYIGYIRENWADSEGVAVSGVILTPSYDEQLRLAAAAAEIKVLRYQLR